MKDDLAESLRIKNTPHTHTKNKPTILTSTIARSSVASPICQEGQNDRTFQIFAYSSRFVLFLPNFSLFFSLFFSRFLANSSLSRVALCPPFEPPVATLLIARALVGILITIKLTEDVPDQRKAQRVIDSRHEYTAWF